MHDRVHSVEFNGAEGRWRFSSLAPAPDVSALVELIWEVEGRTAYTRERILPSGSVELLINLGAPHRLLDRQQPSRGTCFDTLWISGIQRQYLLTETTGDVHILGVRFAAGGARPTLGIGLDELADRVIPLELVLAAEARALREYLLSQDTIADRLLAVEAFVRRRARHAVPPRREVAWMAGAIAASGGAARLRGLYGRLGRSERHVSAQFEREIGVTPKLFARILRFRRVVEHLKTRDAVNWSRLAQACGYYDHAHFDHDFRAFTGASPSEFLQRRSPDGDSLIVDEA